jgi:endonuclease YncB( thermonuclease family)
MTLREPELSEAGSTGPLAWNSWALAASTVLMESVTRTARLLLALLLLTLAACGPEGSLPAHGALRVIDGDTLALGATVVELEGIDAPELGQRCLDGSTLYDCGLSAAFELEKILILESVSCRPREDAAGYDCHTPGGPLVVRLVEEGLALAAGGTGLEPAEDKARRVPLGVWRGAFVQPARWRQGERLPEETLEVVSCPVLGLAGDSPPRYAVPTDPDYEQIAESSAGVSQRFCSDEAARAAGYVHAPSGAPG